MSEIRLNTQQGQWLQAGLMLDAVDDTGNSYTLCEISNLDLPSNAEEGAQRAESILMFLEGITGEFNSDLILSTNEWSGLSFLLGHCRALVGMTSEESTKARSVLKLMEEFDREGQE